MVSGRVRMPLIHPDWLIESWVDTEPEESELHYRHLSKSKLPQETASKLVGFFWSQAKFDNPIYPVCIYPVSVGVIDRLDSRGFCANADDEIMHIVGKRDADLHELQQRSLKYDFPPYPDSETRLGEIPLEFYEYSSIGAEPVAVEERSPGETHLKIIIDDFDYQNIFGMIHPYLTASSHMLPELKTKDLLGNGIELTEYSLVIGSQQYPSISCISLTEEQSKKSRKIYLMTSPDIRTYSSSIGDYARNLGNSYKKAKKFETFADRVSRLSWKVF